MKTPINGETLFEDSVEQIIWNQEAVVVQNPYTPGKILLMAVDNVKNQDYALGTAGSGTGKQLEQKTGPASKLTLLESLKRIATR